MGANMTRPETLPGEDPIPGMGVGVPKFVPCRKARTRLERLKEGKLLEVLERVRELTGGFNRPLLSQISNGEKVHGRDRKKITT